MQKERELKTSFVYIKIEETEFWARNAKKKRLVKSSDPLGFIIFLSKKKIAKQGKSSSQKKKFFF